MMKTNSFKTVGTIIFTLWVIPFDVGYVTPWWATHYPYKKGLYYGLWYICRYERYNITAAGSGSTQKSTLQKAESQPCSLEEKTQQRPVRKLSFFELVVAWQMFLPIPARKRSTSTPKTGSCAPHAEVPEVPEYLNEIEKTTRCTGFSLREISASFHVARLLYFLAFVVHHFIVCFPSWFKQAERHLCLQLLNLFFLSFGMVMFDLGRKEFDRKNGIHSHTGSSANTIWLAIWLHGISILLNSVSLLEKAPEFCLKKLNLVTKKFRAEA